jgi:pimeloyl-ACP methyl ester carboxylesterase
MLTRAVGLIFGVITALIAPPIDFAAFAKPYRPAIFIPGILGSVLEKEGRVLWGEQQSLFTFSELALPLNERTDSYKSSIKATRAINNIAILGAFKIHQYDSLYATLGEIGYIEGSNLFSFPYDWRQSNFESAAALSQFIEAIPALDGEFDIIAHSMGGLVARIYIKEHDKKRRVRTVFNLAVPFQGSLSSLDTLENGWGRLATTIVGGSSAIREVVLSFPSIYELLPRYSGCCIYGVPGRGQEFDALSEEFWGTYKNLPPAFKDPSGIQYIFKQLKSARRLQELVASPIPTHIVERSVAGDLRDTPSRVYVEPNTGVMGPWQKERGDGTVVLVSAANGRIPQTDPAFISHQIIFTDAYVKSLLQRTLDSDAGRFRPYAAPIPKIRTADQKLIDVQGVDIELPSVVRAGRHQDIRITVHVRQRVSPGDVRVSISLSDGAKLAEHLRIEETTSAQVENWVASFNVPMMAPWQPGTYQVIAEIEGIGIYDEYFVVTNP